MPERVPNTEQLDEHLLEIVHALHGAVRQGVSHTDDAKITDRVIEDCKKLLDVIMAGNECFESSWITDKNPTALLPALFDPCGTVERSRKPANPP